MRSDPKELVIGEFLSRGPGSFKEFAYDPRAGVSYDAWRQLFLIILREGFAPVVPITCNTVMLKSDKDDLVDRIENAVNVFGDRIDAFETRVLTAMESLRNEVRQMKQTISVEQRTASSSCMEQLQTIAVDLTQQPQSITEKTRSSNVLFDDSVQVVTSQMPLLQKSQSVVSSVQEVSLVHLVPASNMSVQASDATPVQQQPSQKDLTDVLLAQELSAATIDDQPEMKGKETFAQSSSANENLLGISIAQRSGNVNEEVVKMDVSDEPSVIVCEDEPRKKNPVAGLAPNESLKSSSVFTVKPLTVRKDLFGPVAPERPIPNVVTSMSKVGAEEPSPRKSKDNASLFTPKLKKIQSINEDNNGTIAGNETMLSRAISGISPIKVSSVATPFPSKLGNVLSGQRESFNAGSQFKFGAQSQRKIVSVQTPVDDVTCQVFNPFVDVDESLFGFSFDVRKPPDVENNETTVIDLSFTASTLMPPSAQPSGLLGKIGISQKPLPGRQLTNLPFAPRNESSSVGNMVKQKSKSKEPPVDASLKRKPIFGAGMSTGQSFGSLASSATGGLFLNKENSVETKHSYAADPKKFQAIRSKDKFKSDDEATC